MATYATNTCEPDCADGSFVRTRVPVVLSAPVRTAVGMRFSSVTINAGGDDPETDPLDLH